MIIGLACKHRLFSLCCGHAHSSVDVTKYSLAEQTVQLVLRARPLFSGRDKVLFGRTESPRMTAVCSLKGSGSGCARVGDLCGWSMRKLPSAEKAHPQKA